MDAREIIAGKLPTAYREEWAQEIIDALHDAGIDLVHRDENHGPTLERAAKVVLAQPGMNRQTGYWRQDIAATIRAMGEKK